MMPDVLATLKHINHNKNVYIKIYNMQIKTKKGIKGFAILIMPLQRLQRQQARLLYKKYNIQKKEKNCCRLVRKRLSGRELKEKKVYYIKGQQNTWWWIIKLPKICLS